MKKFETVTVCLPASSTPVDFTEFTGATVGALQAAKQLAQKTQIVVFGIGDEDSRWEAVIKDSAAQLGVSELVLLNSNVDLRLVNAQAAALKDFLADSSPDLVFLPAGFDAADIAGLLASHSDSAVVSDVCRITVNSEGVFFGKSVSGGNWETTVRVSRGMPVATIRSGCTLESDSLETGSELTELQFTRRMFNGEGSGLSAIKVSEYDREDASGISLADATIVVCGGRGVDGDFATVRELANRLGAAVGATRVAADEGWVERSAQIGQTGVNVSPELYLGIGVSGQVHHTSGMQSARHIVAVVDDPEAPLVEMADLAIIGDWKSVVTQILAEMDK